MDPLNILINHLNDEFAVGMEVCPYSNCLHSVKMAGTIDIYLYIYIIILLMKINVVNKSVLGQKQLENTGSLKVSFVSQNQLAYHNNKCIQILFLFFNPNKSLWLGDADIYIFFTFISIICKFFPQNRYCIDR